MQQGSGPTTALGMHGGLPVAPTARIQVGVLGPAAKGGMAAWAWARAAPSVCRHLSAPQVRE